MFEAKLINGGIWKKVLDAIKDLLDEAIFDCSDCGVQLQSLDRSHVSLVSLNLRSDGFAQFRCDRNQSMGVNVNSLNKVLGFAKNDDIITMSAQDNGDFINFIFESTSGVIRETGFDMKQMDLFQEHLGISDVDYACIVKMSSREWSRIVRDLSDKIGGDSIVINCTKRGVTFSSKPTASDKVYVTSGNCTLVQNSSDENPVHIDLQEPVKVTFGSRHLKLFSKGAVLSDEVTLSMASDAPLAVEFKIEELGYIRYYLAPKLEDGDN